MISSVDVIIPTWNSMPEFRMCLNSLDKAFPKSVLRNVIVVDKNSLDDTVNIAKEYGCIVLTDPGSLGSARMTGLKYSNSKWIVFVDSDIVLPEDWFINIRSSIYTYFTLNYDRVGWSFCRTVDDFEPLKSEKIYKMNLDFKNGFRILKRGDRPYTHTSLCLREPLLEADIVHLNSWEDYVLGQCMMDQGFYVVEFPISCIHMRKSTYKKWGDFTEAWSISGELKVKGWNIKILLKPFWFIWWGVRCSIHFRRFDDIKYNSKVFINMVKALFNSRRFFVWKRD